jgi:low temperature requirement protein LtrA
LARAGFGFGYAHYLLFAAVGAISAGIEVELDLLSGASEHLSATMASLALTVPISIFMAAVRLILLRSSISVTASVVFLLATLLVLACALLPIVTVNGAAVCVVVAVAAVEQHRVRAQSQIAG